MTGSLVAALGLPVIDGIGARGAGAHTSDEHILLSDLPFRLALYMRLVGDGVTIHTRIALPDHEIRSLTTGRRWQTSQSSPTGKRIGERRHVDGLHEGFRASMAGGEMTKVMNTAWGTREFHIRDPDGNGLQLYRLL
ncbi:MAG TPA: hypothetical protein VMM79_13250 [Longimicrobiales bacterium]|nr:hypothetical protein [Longimicrobiales bacterium]